MPAPASVLAIGSFDGVHRGHAALLAAARSTAAAHRPAPRVIALAFDPHPLTTLNPAAAPARLTRFDDRRQWLLEAGADEVVRLAPDRSLLSLSPEAFIEKKMREYRPVAIIEGPDFRFGAGRAGDVTTLAALGGRMGFQTQVVEPVSVVLDDHSLVQASSTLCRWLLTHGRIADAARVLGRPFRLAGEVIPGDRRGRTIGFPTANLSVDVMLPADGVYAATALLPDGRRLAAAVNVGERPTFAGAARTVEAHLIQPDAVPGPWAPIAGLAEYHWPLQLDLVGRLRDQIRFASVDALRAQLSRDVARVPEILARGIDLPVPSVAAAAHAGAPA